MKYFKKITENKTVVMGYNTYLSIGKSLPNRTTIVVCFDKINLPDALVITDLHKVLTSFKPEAEVFVIGGKSVYEQSIYYADRLYITHIDKEHEGDIFLTKFDLSNFKLISEKKNGILTFAVYEKINKEKHNEKIT
jgi:dihydrofolate reductase